MHIHYKNLTIRNATNNDASQLCLWWNNGKVMAHAGFPKGLNTSEEKIIAQMANDTDMTRRRLIIEKENIPIGEMSYYNLGDNIVEIGIKICDFSKQNQGLGKILLSMLIQELFSMGFTKIILDTNLKNLRAQHVYEQLGFVKVATRMDSWKNQLGELQSSIDYELLPNQFISYL